jgi:hypothetical protein
MLRSGVRHVTGDRNGATIISSEDSGGDDAPYFRPAVRRVGAIMDELEQP